MAILEARSLTVTYGGLRANSDVSLEVASGSFVGLIGPNGAGKTTFIDAVTGFTPLSGGSVQFDGENVTDIPAHQLARRGLRRTFQNLELFEDLTIEENLRVSVEQPVWNTFIVDMFHPCRSTVAEEGIAWALAAAGLTGIEDALPSDLSHGQRKLVGVARALVSRPKLLLLDEPAAGLDTAESQALGVELRRLLNEGISILMIDHDMGFVMSTCDRLYVLDFGKIISTGTPEEIRADEKVISAYLGESAGESEAQDGGRVAAMDPLRDPHEAAGEHR